ncbi:MAG: murein biosynthesis integral membrane protein MurJ [Candidatus Eisenbacteria bacterium]|nr:murein biosynthesis integral membrane protein MurJ [Candidatus Eisenbacteria bacterium]
MTTLDRADVEGRDSGAHTDAETSGNAGHKVPGVRVIVSALWVIGFMLLGKLLGLVKDVVVAAKYGTSASMDAFLVAFTVPILISSWLRSPLRSGFVPLFTEGLERDGEKKTWRAAGTFLGDLLVLSAVVAIAGFVFAPQIVSLVAPGFDPPEHALAASLVRIMIGTVFLGAFSGIMGDVLHCYGNFMLPEMRHPARNLFLIGGAVLLTGTLGIRGLAWGFLAGSVAGILIQSPFYWKHRSKIRLGLDFRHPMFLGVMRLALPLFIGMAGAKLDDVIDRVFASMLSEGSISGLSYAMRLIDIPREILVVGFSTVLFPFFARVVARGRMEVFADRFISALRIAFFALFPVSVMIAILGEPFVRVVFQRGAFDEQSVTFTVSALLLYTPTLWALGLTSVMISGFVAMKDTKTPVVVGLVRLALKVGLIFAFIGAFQHAGIALATSVSHVFKLGLFLLMVPREIRRGRYGKLFRGFAGVAVATAIMGAVLYFTGPFFVKMGEGASLTVRVLALAAPAVLGIAVYLGAAYLLAREDLREAAAVFRDGLRTLLRKAGRRAPGAYEAPPVDDETP